MGAAITPCPPWCQVDHARYRDHCRPVGNVDGLAVYAYQFGDKPPVVSLVMGGRSIQTIDLNPAAVAAVAGLMQEAQRTIQGGGS